jgi:hypothetical protein
MPATIAMPAAAEAGGGRGRRVLGLPDEIGERAVVLRDADVLDRGRHDAERQIDEQHVDDGQRHRVTRRERRDRRGDDRECGAAEHQCDAAGDGGRKTARDAREAPARERQQPDDRDRGEQLAGGHRPARDRARPQIGRRAVLDVLADRRCDEQGGQHREHELHEPEHVDDGRDAVLALRAHHCREADRHRRRQHGDPQRAPTPHAAPRHRGDRQRGLGAGHARRSVVRYSNTAPRLLSGDASDATATSCSSTAAASWS